MDSGAGNVDQGTVDRDFANSTTPKGRVPDDKSGGRPSRPADRNVQRDIANRVNRA
jgi:hypothetical protein